jgi:phage shock protein PspC (stress-responsive transcriptional regulator)
MPSEPPAEEHEAMSESDSPEEREPTAATDDQTATAGETAGQATGSAAGPAGTQRAWGAGHLPGGGSGSGNAASTAGGGYPPPGAPARALRRSRGDRKLAGVCGGLGAYTNTDPIIFRVLFAVFTLFGGFGLLLYGVAWLFVPEEGQDRSEAQQLFREGHTSAGALWAIAATVVGLLIFVAIAANEWDVVFWLLVVAAIAFVLLRSRTPRPHPVGPWWTAPPPTGPGGAGAGATPGTSQSPSATGHPQAQWTAPPEAEPTAGDQTARSAPPAGGWPGPPSSHASWPTDEATPGRTSGRYEPAGEASPRAALPAAYPPTTEWRPQPQPATRREPSSAMPWLTLSAALVVGGAMAVLDIADVIDLGAQGVAATILIVLGLGLLVSAWYGRARSLIALGIAAVIALVVVSAVDVPLSGGFGERHIEPTSAADLARDPVRLTAGKIVIDLTRYNQPAGSASLEASVGAGQIVVIYPADIRLQATADVSAGNIDTLGASDLRVNGEQVMHEPAGRSRGDVRLNLDLGTGNIRFEEGSRASS